MSENRYRIELVRELKAGDYDLLEEVSILDNQTDPFYVSPSPVFMAAERFKLGVSKVNMVWLDYSRLLMQLSSKELVSDEKFQELSTELNANALDAIQSVKDDPSDEIAENVALFSEVAVGLAKEFIRKKQKNKLIEFLSENQGEVENYVAHMQQAIVSMAQINTQEHTEKQGENIRVLIGIISNNADGKQDVKIQKFIGDIIEVKRAHSTQMASLQALYEAYGRIPEAHAALTDRLRKSDASLTAITALLEKGIQMYASYESKAKANKAELVQAKADAANSEAMAMELKYQQAELKASQAQYDYVLAQNILKADPDNETKQEDVERKKTIAAELRLEADDLKESATALRAAATAVQESANELKKSITSN